ncbi:MAG: FAD-dependent oxidoreductase [Acidobacteria bacterium]|nr:FAD-dependent oxidoreductase [Acidobacteriota bacterium]
MSKKRPANSSALPQTSEQDEYVDVAIVGAGVSGVYCGWRLSACAPGEAEALLGLSKGEPGKSGRRRGRLKIRLYESDERIGGRLFSVTPPEMPHLRAEVGGMRYLTTHRLLVNLIEQLHLSSKPFPMGEKGHTLFYLRRRHLRLEDFADPAKVPYGLAWNERGKSPAELMLYAINTVVRHAEQKTEEEWERIKREKMIFGTHMYDLGFWNLLYQILSSEAYNLIQDAGGYSSILSNWNAGEAIPWFLADFPKDVTYRTLTFGYDQLPLALAERFEGAEGADTKIHTGHRLTSFELPGRNDKWITLNFERRKRVKARRLILAMPRRSLELVLGKDLSEDEELRRDVESVRPQPAAKLFLGYREPWWQVLNLTSGRSSTDLPIRQTYYFGTECEEKGADPDNTCSLLMASYNDGPSVGFWKGLLDRKPGTNEVNHPFKGDLKNSKELDSLRAQNLIPSRGMVREAHYELKQLHGIDLYIPKPYMAIYKDWGEDPFGGGWHFWKMSQKPWEVMKRMRAPRLRGRQTPHVYVCGEAYSCNQGWVEGALKSAELLLQEHFGLKAPAWLPKDYDLGP